MDTAIVIMEKNKKTGLFEKELQSLKIEKYEDIILNIYAIKDEQDELVLKIKLTTDRDVLDWEYNAIYDHYDMNIFENMGYSIIECENEYNPTWEVCLKYIDDVDKLTKIVNDVLVYHKNELIEILKIIQNLEGEYKYEE